MQYRHYRYPCRYPLSFRDAVGDHHGIVINVSRNGALVQFAEGEAVGRALKFWLLGMPRQARVIRATGKGPIGIRFDHPLTQREFDVVRAATARGRGAGTYFNRGTEMR